MAAETYRVHRGEVFIYSNIKHAYWPVIFEENEWAIFKVVNSKTYWFFHYSCNEETNISFDSCCVCGDKIPEKLYKTGRMLD